MLDYESNQLCGITSEMLEGVASPKEPATSSSRRTSRNSFASRNYPHTPEQIAKELRVDEKGNLWWKRSASGRRRDEPVGSKHSQIGYLRFMVLGHRYLAHVICWVLYYKEWPESHIDHIDGNTFNNRKSNLRKVTQSENKHNPQKLQDNNTSGVPGVKYLKRDNTWMAALNIRGTRIYGGVYRNYEDAVEARRQLEVKHGVDKYSLLTKSLTHNNSISTFQNISL